MNLQAEHHGQKQTVGNTYLIDHVVKRTKVKQAKDLANKAVAKLQCQQETKGLVHLVKAPCNFEAHVKEIFFAFQIMTGI